MSLSHQTRQTFWRKLVKTDQFIIVKNGLAYEEEQVNLLQQFI
jgi:hypothetical protein